jgi:hypothetical protein
MELEIVLRVPTSGSTLQIPTRERIFEPGVPGGRMASSVQVAEVGGLAAVELAGGQLRIALKTGEAYQFAIAELPDGDAVLRVQDRPDGTRSDPLEIG